jgi:DNA (cytosine-5)-methyltransferase 1
VGREAPQTAQGRHYGVPLVRGPFVQLAPHADECSDEHSFLVYAAKLRAAGARLAADLFSGAGGLSLGLQAAGYHMVLAVDHDTEAIETHRHHFGGLALDWNLGDPDRIAKVADLIAAADVELLAGGPPCQPFSRAGRNKIRHRIRNGYADPSHERRDLWQSYLEIIKRAMPRAVVMENVPDMALDREMFILRTMVDALESLGYAVDERVVNTSRYGVPQFRQRLILVALRDGASFSWPIETPDKVTVWNAIGDLPPVEGGWRPPGGANGWADYDRPRTEFQSLMRQGISDAEAGRVYDHITRPVRDDDARAFQLMDATTLYSHLPAEVKRYRDDIFDDKYKRLDENNLSRTITAHIAKDGYWYIHPRQNRTLTVREAARLQTFPDRFRFAGPPTAAFRQIGNAVPPLLGEHLGKAVRSALANPQSAGPSTQQIAGALARWFVSLPALTVPWLRAETRWQVIMAETLLERMPTAQIRVLWPVLARWKDPVTTLAAKDELYEMAHWVGRGHRAARVLELAEQLEGSTEDLDLDEAIRRIPGLNVTLADLAVLAVPTGTEDDSEEPVLASRGVLRVVARFTGDRVDRRNRMSDGRLGVARMIGNGKEARDAHRGLIELAANVCRPEIPLCAECPLSIMCLEAQTAAGHQEILFRTDRCV